MSSRKNLVFVAAVVLAASLAGQEANPTQKRAQPEPGMPSPIFRVEVVARTTQAVNYLHRGGATKIDFQGTALLPTGKGSAKVESERGVIHVSAEFKNMALPSSYGPEYLTYVLWAISPDGRPVNLGELTLNDYGAGSNSKIDTTSDIQTFGMIVTAEPYYAVTQPSDVVVMENIVRPDTRGVIESINAKYELLPRGMYTSQGRAAGFVPVQPGKKDPFELYEAENAVQLARVAGAEKYAADSYQKANDALRQALKYQAQKPGQKPVITMAREAAVRAEDARVIALRAERLEAQENERQAGIARENAEKAKAEASRLRAEEEARQRAQADAQRAQADADRIAAERARADAQAATQAAQQERAAAELAKRQADDARQAAVAEQQKLAADADRARQAAAEADSLRQQSEQQQAQLRQQLLEQFNQILQTRDTARGLIVNMSDVLFDTAQYTLRPGAREKLAKVSGIILGHPGLKIAVEGHTDSVGGDEYNMRLSENRANSVRQYLVSQGVSPASVTAQGFGKTMPVADNGNAAGRQMNRRVELVVSGDILGTTITETRTTRTITGKQ
jgi:outer membrane protein OmpA-like peptidoglycan-associated protein